MNIFGEQRYYTDGTPLMEERDTPVTCDLCGQPRTIQNLCDDCAWWSDGNLADPSNDHMTLDGKRVIDHALWKDGAGGWMVDVAVFEDGTAATDAEMQRLGEKYQNRLTEEWEERKWNGL